MCVAVSVQCRFGSHSSLVDGPECDGEMCDGEMCDGEMCDS